MTHIGRCEATIIRDGLPTMCGRPLDEHENCDRASQHYWDPWIGQVGCEVCLSTDIDENGELIHYDVECFK